MQNTRLISKNALSVYFGMLCSHTIYFMNLPGLDDLIQQPDAVRIRINVFTLPYPGFTGNNPTFFFSPMTRR